MFRNPEHLFKIPYKFYILRNYMDLKSLVHPIHMSVSLQKKGYEISRIVDKKKKCLEEVWSYLKELPRPLLYGYFNYMAILGDLELCKVILSFPYSLFTRSGRRRLMLIATVQKRPREIINQFEQYLNCASRTVTGEMCKKKPQYGFFCTVHARVNYKSIFSKIQIDVSEEVQQFLKNKKTLKN